MPLERDDVEGALLKKGFEADDKGHNRDHRFYRLHVGGKRTSIFTKVSRGSHDKTLRDPLVKRIAQQLQLTKKEFETLVECSLSGAAYVDLLRERVPRFL